MSSKWGYTYTADWQVDAVTQEVKDHRIAALERQWPETSSLLGPWLRLYQVHSATLESGVLDDRAVHRALGRLGVPVGVTLSGPRQAETLRKALDLTVDGAPVFSAVQATWNIAEPSVGAALGEARRPVGRSSSKRCWPTDGCCPPVHGLRPPSATIPTSPPSPPLSRNRGPTSY